MTIRPAEVRRDAERAPRARAGWAAVGAVLAAALFAAHEPTRSRPARALELAFAAAGLAAGFLGLFSIVGAPGVALLAAISTGLVVAAGQRRPGRAARAVRIAARVGVGIVLAFFAYEAISIGSMIHGAVPALAIAAIAVLAVASLATSVRRARGPIVALVVPLGAWVGACVMTWSTEIGTVRCDDYLRTVAQPSVEVLVASTASLARCRPGERVAPRAHPRKLFAGTRAGRFFVAVQEGHASHRWLGEVPVPDPTSTFTGGLCEMVLEGNPSRARLACREDLPGLYALAYRPGSESLYVGGAHGVERLSARAPFPTLDAVETGYASTLVIAPGDEDRRLLVFYDHMDRVDELDARTLAHLSTRPLPIAPEEVRYDAARREGVYCGASTPLFAIGGRPYLALAVGEDLRDVRLLGSDHAWAWLAFSDGCDVDLAARRVYVGVGTLGLLAVLDYDTGAVLRTHAVAFGLRPVLLDPRRGRLYVGGYLDGWVRELDPASGAQLRRWYVGRFVRHIVPDPTGPGLLVTSTLGIVRIDPSVREERG